MPATPLVETPHTRDPPVGQPLGFRGFAAGFHPGLDAFLSRNAALLGGLTRIDDPDTLMSCIRDMRPDYLVLGALDRPADLRDRLQVALRSPQLAVLLPGQEAGEAGTHAAGLILEPLAADADPAKVAMTLRALMRRTRPQAMVGRAVWGDLDLDEACLTFAIGGRSVSLSLEVFSVLGLMMDEPERVWDRDTLHRYVFGAASRNDIRAIDTRISRARRHVSAALGRDPIRTVRGVGYVLVPNP